MLEMSISSSVHGEKIAQYVMVRNTGTVGGGGGGSCISIVSSIIFLHQHFPFVICQLLHFTL